MHLPPNLLSIPALSTLVGFISGLASSAQLSSLQFTAENAHRQPRTLRGWYFYQKTKNYKVIWAGVKGGLRKGGLLGGWTTAFVGLQEGIDAAAAAAAQSDWQFQGRRTASGALSGTLVALAMSSICKSQLHSRYEVVLMLVSSRQARSRNTKAISHGPRHWRSGRRFARPQTRARQQKARSCQSSCVLVLGE